MRPAACCAARRVGACLGVTARLPAAAAAAVVWPPLPCLPLGAGERPVSVLSSLYTPHLIHEKLTKCDRLPGTVLPCYCCVCVDRTTILFGIVVQEHKCRAVLQHAQS